MSEAIAFDTHRYVKRLTECGFSEKQAETLAEEHVALLNTNLATKTDISKIEARIAEVEVKIEALRKETKSEIEALRQETKTGIEALRKETKSEIEALRQETRTEIEKVKSEVERVKSDLLKWIFGALIAQGGLIVALVKLL